MSLQTDAIPEAILAKHPELAQISEAIAAYRDGVPVTAQCPKCGHTLAVADMPELGSLWVTCDTGCTSFHLRYEPARDTQG
jgi:hypothetical protein